jgi:LysM repeat protein
MQIRSRALGAVIFAAAPLLLVTACSGGDTPGGSSSNLTPITGSNYVTIEPATTTTTTTSPPVDVNALEPGQTSPVAQTYTIKSGDSLSKIATLYGIEMQVICSYNQWPDCGGDHLLLPGDTVSIPPDSLIPTDGVSTDAPTTGDSTAASGDAATGDGCTHTIEAGENPTRVANKYDLSYDQLQAANPGIDFTTTFVVGTVLTIPPEGNCG